MKCHQCGFENPDNASVCKECGTQIAGFVRPSDVYRLITAMSVEIVGYRSLFNTMEYDTAVTVAGEYTAFLSDIIKKYNGFIYRCESDFILCLFGVPAIREDDPEQALTVAAEMLKSAKGMSEFLAGKYGSAISLTPRIGIHRGKTIIKPAESRPGEYAVIGDVIDIAVRIKDYSSHSDILVSEPVFAATRYLYDYEALPPVPLTSARDLSKIFRPLRLKPRPEPKHGISGLYSPLVGRDDELGTLNRYVSALEEGHGGLVLIMGDAGIGKSRLWNETKKMVVQGQKAVQIYEASGQSFTEVVPNRVMILMIKEIFNVLDNDMPQIIGEKIIKKTREIAAQDWQRIAPYIGSLLGVRFHSELDELVSHLGAHELRQQIMSSVKELLLAVAEKQPLLLVIDDFHYIDTASLEFIEALVADYLRDRSDEGVSPAGFFPIMFIGIARRDKERSFWAAKERLRERLKSEYGEILLGPLEPSMSMQVIDNLLTLNEIPDDFKARISTAAGGNPFYIEEMIRSFIDNGVLFYDAGIWRLNKKSESIEMPSNIQLAIFSRLEQLGDERDVLEKAAAVGRIFQESILECLKGVDRLALSVKLALLEDLEYISRVPHAAEPEYMFKHPLVREAIYNSMSAGQLKSLHRQVAECVKTMHADDISGYYEVLAHHYYMAEEWDKSYDYSMKSARKSMGYYLNREALLFLNQALRSIRQTRETRGEKQSAMAIEAIKEKVGILLLVGDNERALTELNKGMAISQKIKDKKCEADFLLLQSEIHGATSAYDQMLTAAESALSLYKTMGDVKGQSECYNNIGVVYNNLGSHDKAFEFYNQSLRLMEEINDRQGTAIGLNNIGYVYHQQGNFEKALDFYNRTLAIMREINNKRGAAIALDNIGTVHAGRGEYEKAIECHDRSLMIKEGIGDRWGESASTNNIGYVHYLLGHYDQSLQYHLRSLKIKEEIGDQWGQAVSFNNIGHIYLVWGDYIKAFDHYTASLKISERLGNRSGITASILGIGQLFTAQNRFIEARDYLARAELLARETGNKDYLKRASIALCSHLLLTVATAGDEGASDIIKRALEYQQQAYSLAVELNSNADIARAVMLRARIYAAQDKFEDARKAYQETIKAFEDLRLPLELGEACHYYGQMLRSHGQEWEGGEQLEKGRKIFRAINARDWLRRLGDDKSWEKDHV
jgi:tetratricopeptide (TPR) repeat protein/class 3 adenylate cyclase